MKMPSDLGRYFFAVATVGSGIQQVVRFDYVRLVSKPTVLVQWQPVLAVITGLILILAGTAMLVGSRVRLGALTVAGLLLFAFFVQRIAEIAANPGTGFIWTNPAKMLALLGGALLIAARDPAAACPRWLERAAALGPILLSLFLFIGGFQHFDYANFVDTLVPGWLSHPRFWTLFAGTCLMAGGVGLVIPATTRLAGLFSGVMIFLWVLMLHIPRALAPAADSGETSAIFEALAISGAAFLVATRPRS